MSSRDYTRAPLVPHCCPSAKRKPYTRLESAERARTRAPREHDTIRRRHARSGTTNSRERSRRAKRASLPLVDRRRVRVESSRVAVYESPRGGLGRRWVSLSVDARRSFDDSEILAILLLSFFSLSLSLSLFPRLSVDRTTVIARATDDKDDATRKRALPCASLSRGDPRALCNLPYDGVKADADPWRTFERA